MTYVSPNGTGLITRFEGKPRLKARLCEGGAYEVGYGCTYYPDGRAVGPNDTISEDMVQPMLAHCMAVELAPVIRVLDREPNQNWIDAFASLGYNCGGHNIASQADAVRLFNSGKDMDAAAAFVGWISATSSGPSDKELSDPYYAGVWEERLVTPKKGEPYLANLWIGPDGNPCEYRRKMRGLLRRRLAEGCVALGYDGEVACSNDAVFLTRERIWNASKSRWEDRVISMTQLKDVLPVARKYPLQATAEPPKAAAPVVEVMAEPLPEVDLPPGGVVIAEPAPKPVEKPVSAPRKPPVVSNGSLPNDFDPDDGMKAMVYSRRFWGWLLIILGRLSFITDGGSHALAQAGGAVGNVANAIAADPMLLDMYTGMSVMFVGEAVRWWGEKKATRPLK